MCLYLAKGTLEESIWWVGMTIFMVVWFVFVPIAMTSRLEKAIKLLEEIKNK